MKFYIIGIVILCLAKAQAKDEVEEKVEEEQITKGKPAPAGASAAGPAAVPAYASAPVPPRLGGGPIIRGSAYFRDGHCTGFRQIKDTVLRQPTPYLTKRVTYTWDGYGYYRATCIKVNSRHPHDGATVSRLFGGIGDTYIVLDLITAFGGGMDFDVEIWGEAREWNGEYYN